MITYEDLVSCFGESVKTLRDDIFKFAVNVPKFKLFNYLWCDSKTGKSFLLLSKNVEDDEYAFFYIFSIS